MHLHVHRIELNEDGIAAEFLRDLGNRAGTRDAVFPMDLVRPCILAGCPKGKTVLDPFAGSGTVGQVAEELGRNAVLIELNPLYVEMQKGRNGIKGVMDSPTQGETGDDQDKPGWLF